MTDYLQKIPEQEIRSTFYQAIIITTTGKEMTLDELLKAMKRIQADNDADKNNTESENPSASRAKSFKSKPIILKCHRCNSKGH